MADWGTFKVTEAIEVKLSDVCRGCLTKTNNMTKYFSKNEAITDIIAMLSSIGSFEVELNEYLPSYLCKECEEKLKLSYNFQLLVQKSNEIIRQCVNNPTTVVTEVEDNIIEVVKLDDNENISGDSDGDDEKPKKQTLRLSQFSADEVEKAIEESKEKFYANITCIKCGFISCNNRALSAHMTHIHKELKDHWCSICNSEVEFLSEHLSTHAHEDLTCKFCGKIFNGKGHFTEHLRSHSNSRPFRCHICNKGFISTRHLNAHLKVHTNDRPYKCSVCPKSFLVLKGLKTHMQQHEVELKEDPDNHKELKISVEPQNYCKLCERKVRSFKGHYKKYHQSISENQEKDKLLCTICGKQFRTGGQFRRHTRVHTGEAPYKCSHCPKRTTSRNQLVVHERTHTGERPHACAVCGRAFAQSSVLGTHMRTHTGRPHSCDVCGRGFCRPTQLRLHMREHTGEKPFRCDECARAFKQKSHLMEHLKTHSEERPFRCEFCDRGFKQKSSLKSHTQIHLGKKPYKCSQCPYACRQSYSLTQHMKQHSNDQPIPERPHICSVCQKGFSTVAMLISHENNIHNSIYVNL